MKISCIIPVFNEEKQIKNTLSSVLSVGHEHIDEVIVVNDGSTDMTKILLKEFQNIHVISHKKNLGKSRAIATGICAASGNYILLLDADLINLSPENILSLIKPVKEGLADVSISIRKNSWTIFKKIGFDLLSGERIFPQQIVAPYTHEIQNLPNLGLEVFLNRIIIRNKCRIVSVFWSNVDNHLKYKKRGFWKGIQLEILMCIDIIRVISPYEFIYQMISLSKLLSRTSRRRAR